MKTKFEQEVKMNKIKKVEIKPTLKEIEEHKKLQETWCRHEKKFVYDPTKRKHCPYCGGLF